jgi:hypothetical protein
MVPKSFTIEEFQLTQFEDLAEKLKLSVSALVRLSMEILAKKFEDGATLEELWAQVRTSPSKGFSAFMEDSDEMLRRSGFTGTFNQIIWEKPKK